MDKRTYYKTATNTEHLCNEMRVLPIGHKIQTTPPGRNLDQNSALWALLSEISKQVVWYGQKLTPEEWKDVLTASLKKQRVVPGLDGGFVICGSSTSKMSKADFSELLELGHAFAAQQGVKLSA